MGKKLRTIEKLHHPRVGKFLDASTNFILPKDMELLTKYQEAPDQEDRDIALPRIIPHRFGWWINVQWQDAEQLAVDRERLAAAGMSISFRTVYDHAVASKCDWINLDRDA